MPCVLPRLALLHAPYKTASASHDTAQPFAKQRDAAFTHNKIDLAHTSTFEIAPNAGHHLA